MYKQVAFMAALLMCCGSVKARIDETETQITARYGESIGDIPTETFGPVRGFALPEFLVGVKIVNGVSAMEMISKNDQSDISPAEIETLLKKHGADMPWKADPFEKPDWKRWRTQDGSLVAVYDTKRHFLYVNSKQFYDQHTKRDDKQKELQTKELSNPWKVDSAATKPAVSRQKSEVNNFSPALPEKSGK